MRWSKVSRHSPSTWATTCAPVYRITAIRVDFAEFEPCLTQDRDHRLDNATLIGLVDQHLTRDQVCEKTDKPPIHGRKAPRLSKSRSVSQSQLRKTCLRM